MKRFHLFLPVLLLCMITGCFKQRLGEFSYNIENKLPYAVEARFKSVGVVDSSAFIPANTVKSIPGSSYRGETRDIYYDTLYIFSSLRIYRADTLLVKKDVRARKEWIFSQTGDRSATYLLIIDQDDLK
jgi:hypothetical protein